MRILFAGNFGESENGALFFSTNRKLANGFTRNGHDVMTFSVRDVARTATPLRSKSLGAKTMNRRFLETVENFAPQMIVLAQADLIARATLEAIRARPDRPRLAIRNLDLMTARTVENVRLHADLVDAIFQTTAGAALKQFSGPGRVISFMPNPVCRAIDTGRSFDNASPANDVFHATRDTRDKQRAEWCREIKRRLPDLRTDFRGFDGKPPVFGIAYLQAIADARMGLSLDKEMNRPLYSSDRIAQYVGNGLLTFVHRGSGYGSLFSDKELAFFDDLDDLVAGIGRYAADDAEARVVAQNGWKRYHDIFSVDLVTRYMVEVTFREPLSHDYAWPTELY